MGKTDSDVIGCIINGVERAIVSVCVCVCVFNNKGVDLYCNVIYLGWLLEL